MKKRFSDEQIISILSAMDAELNTVADILLSGRTLYVIQHSSKK
ncbi:hypothetical protein C7433_102442 [Pantoea sp. PNA 03-3]|nr:hypothetical protein C7433_102442 [Pantoea sp. PNA 03-3]